MIHQSRRMPLLVLALPFLACADSDPAWLGLESAAVHERYDSVESDRLVPLLQQVVRFPTFAGNAQAVEDQKSWLIDIAATLGFETRDADTVFEIELPGPEGAPVLGLVVHGDVVPVEPDAWSFSPFEAEVRGDTILGRGVADDKGPLVQALLAMTSLAESGLNRTHTIRLLVGTDEESAGATDMQEYLGSHEPPAYSLVLDSEFPVVVGEKGWNAPTFTAHDVERPEPSPTSYSISSLDAGIATSIVPDRAELTLHWRHGEAEWTSFLEEVRSREVPDGLELSVDESGGALQLVVSGKSAHAGVNLEGGRNALIGLARLTDGLLPAGGASDLLAFAAMAGRDLYGSGLGITDRDPLWGRYAVNVATIKEAESGDLVLTINVRRIPPRTGAQLREYLEGVVEEFNAAHGSELVIAGYFDDEPLAFDPNSQLVRRLLAVYERTMGERLGPAISGGGTYAKRLPRAIAFGMWFPDKPYTGHDVDEHTSITDLHSGTHVLIEALVDLATNEPLSSPFSE